MNFVQVEFKFYVEGESEIIMFESSSIKNLPRAFNECCEHLMNNLYTRYSGKRMHFREAIIKTIGPLDIEVP